MTSDCPAAVLSTPCQLTCEPSTYHCPASQPVPRAALNNHARLNYQLSSSSDMTGDEHWEDGDLSSPASQPSSSSPSPTLPTSSPLHNEEAGGSGSFAFRAFVPWTVESFILAQSTASPPLSAGSAVLSRPCMSSYVGSLLFVDISGFTALSERLSQQGTHGLELLTEQLNRYFTLVIDTIHQHGGDVVKFAGDALLCLFAQQWTDEEHMGELEVEDGTEQAEQADCEYSLEVGADRHANLLSSSAHNTARHARSALTVHTRRASLCALSIHSTLDFYSPMPSSTLRLHSAIVSGLMYGLHVGGCRDRWEFVLEGEPLHSLQQAMRVSEKGQIVIHRSATRWVSRWTKVELISSGNASAGACEAAASCRLLVGVTRTPVSGASSGRTANLRRPHLTIVVPQPATSDNQRLLSRAAPTAAHNSTNDASQSSTRARCALAMRGYVPSAILARVAYGHTAWLAEFRRVATLFILLPDLNFGAGVDGLSSLDTERSCERERREQLLAVFQRRVQLVMEVCYAHRGDVRQLITDDKGTVMILLFGLHADIANPLLGVQAALAVHSRMSAERLGAVAIGVTTGQVFCGTVGSAVRREYTAVGDKVNTAARLMAAVAGRDGILVDADTVDAIGRNHPRVAFHALEPVRLKGKEHPVPVFTPRVVLGTSGNSKRGGKVEAGNATVHSSLLAGRRQQQQQLILFLQSTSLPCNRLYIDAASRGMSKSLLLQWAAQRCRQIKSHRVFFSRADEMDQTAYFAFQPLIPALLHTLWKLHPCRRRRGSACSGGDEPNSGTDVGNTADWLSDPSTLALPHLVAADPSSLLLLNQICPTVQFRTTATQNGDVLYSPLSAHTPVDHSTAPAAAASTCVKKETPAGKVLWLISTLLSHAHDLSSDVEYAGSDDVRAGTVVMVDDAHLLDSASEELLLKLSEQLPAIQFVFAGVHCRRASESSSGSGVHSPTRQNLRRRLTAVDEPRKVDPTSLASLPCAETADAAAVCPVPFWLASHTTALHYAYLVVLDRFSAADLSLLVQAELDCQHVCSTVTAFLLERSGGIPAFALEMLRALHKGRLLQLTMELETAIDASGRVRSHILNSTHLQRVKEQGQRLHCNSQHSRGSSADMDISHASSNTSPLTSAAPATRVRALSHPLSPTSAPAPLPPLSLPTTASVLTPTAPDMKLHRVCSFVSHWWESEILSSLPASMDEMLASRFDACSPGQQMMLRMAAVFGRSVDTRCMRQLWQQYGCHKHAAEQQPAQQCESAVGAAADDMCQSLLTLGVLVEETNGCSSVSYAFAESSMQDMIYQRLPFSLRCRLHLAITAWYESVYSGDQLQPFYSRLAYHFFQAANPSLQHAEADTATPQSASPSSMRATLLHVGSFSTTSTERSSSASSTGSRSPASSAPSSPGSTLSPDSASSTCTAHYAAIRYLKLAAQAAIQQHAKREAVVALRQCQSLLKGLPDAQSLYWKRERLSVMALYAPTHAHLVGTALSMDAFGSLLALCEEVQQMMDSQLQHEPSDSSTAGAVPDQTVLQTFYALRGFYFALLGANMVKEAHALAPRISTIALASNDLLLLHHSWIVLAATNCEHGQLHEGIGFCDRIVDSYHRQQADCPTPYTVNPLAPMCPVVWGMGLAIQMLPLIGHSADVVRRSQAALELAELRGEPVAYQETIYHIVFGKSYLELSTEAEIAAYWAHVRSSNYQMVSLQLECLFALAVDPRTRWGEFRESAVRVWGKLCAGAQFLLTLSVPLLQLLLSAGMWREGMAVVDRWRARAVRDGFMDGFHSECLRFQAQYKLLKAHEQLTAESSDRQAGGVAASVDELVTALAELQIGIQNACRFRAVLMEARCLLTSIHIQQLLLHIAPFPSTALPFSQLIAPPHIDLERPFQQQRFDEIKLVGVSVAGVRSQQSRLAQLVAILEGQCDENVHSTFFVRARYVVQQRF